MLLIRVFFTLCLLFLRLSYFTVHPNMFAHYQILQYHPPYMFTLYQTTRLHTPKLCSIDNRCNLALITEDEESILPTNTSIRTIFNIRLRIDANQQYFNMHYFTNEKSKITNKYFKSHYFQREMIIYNNQQIRQY